MRERPLRNWAEGSANFVKTTRPPIENPLNIYKGNFEWSSSEWFKKRKVMDHQIRAVAHWNRDFDNEKFAKSTEAPTILFLQSDSGNLIRNAQRMARGTTPSSSLFSSSEWKTNRSMIDVLSCALYRGFPHIVTVWAGPSLSPRSLLELRATATISNFI